MLCGFGLVSSLQESRRELIVEHAESWRFFEGRAQVGDGFLGAAAREERVPEVSMDGNRFGLELERARKRRRRLSVPCALEKKLAEAVVVAGDVRGQGGGLLERADGLVETTGLG